MIFKGNVSSDNATRSHVGDCVSNGHAIIAQAPRQVLLHRDSGSGASSLYASGALPLSEASIGISVIATISEINIAKVTVSAWSRNNCPATPCTNTSGKNTATVVSVDAITAIDTSRVPFTAASTMPRPR